MIELVAGIVLAVFCMLFGMMLWITVRSMKGGYIMAQRDYKKEGFTPYQALRIRRYEGSKLHKQIMEYYRLLNKDKTVGKVLDLKGNIIHKGYKSED